MQARFETAKLKWDRNLQKSLDKVMASIRKTKDVITGKNSGHVKTEGADA